MRRSRFVLAIAALVAACGSSGTTSPGNPGGTGDPPPMTATVNATASNAFNPSSVAIGVGGTVTFSFGSVAHNVYFDNSPAGAPDPIPGANANTSQSRTFATAGTYEFDCHIHPGMKGTVVVSNANTTPPVGGGTGY